MNATFPQPSIVHALCVTLVKLMNEPVPLGISATHLAESVASRYPGVPLQVLRVLAAKVLALYFDPLAVEDIERHLPDRDEQIVACTFLGTWANAMVAELATDVTIATMRNKPAAA